MFLVGKVSQRLIDRVFERSRQADSKARLGPRPGSTHRGRISRASRTDRVVESPGDALQVMGDGNLRLPPVSKLDHPFKCHTEAHLTVDELRRRIPKHHSTSVSQMALFIGLPTYGFGGLRTDWHKGSRTHFTTGRRVEV